MATAADVQITCKISEMPKSKTINGMVVFTLMENNQTITVKVKPKQFKQFTDHQFEYWGAAVRGKLGPVTPTGIELLNPGIQIFEQKPNGSQPQASSQTTAKKKLTDGIHFG
ncbi:MAG: hypothetical protein WA902_14375 [Thermosynechococcaceae cyanobacterium]